LGLSALDIAALDLSTENVMLSSFDSPSTMPGAPNSNPGRQGVARLLLAAGNADAATVDFDLTLDADLLDLLDHAAAWHHALAGRASIGSRAAQSPAAPYVATVDAASARGWVGLPFPAALGDAPVTSAVIVGDDVTGALTGVELDAWTEVVPNAVGTGAVTA